jgi:hypothetical protein
MALSLEQLRAAFKTPERSGNTLPNNYYPFFNMKTGEQATVRFLPDANADNPLGFLVEKLTHVLEINGERKTVPCLRMYGEDCPICAVSSAYYKAEDKVNGKKYWRKKSHLAQALVVEDPMPADEQTGETHEGKVRFLNLGYQVYNVIKDAFESGELDDVPFAFEGGCNFILKKTQQGEYPAWTMSKFARSESDLTAEEIEIAEEGMIDLSTLLPKNPGREKVEAMLEAALSGAEYVEPSSGDSAPTTPAPASAPASAPAPAPAPAPTKAENVKETSVPTPAVSDEDSEGGEADAEKILAQIRARRNKRAE